MEGMGRPPGDRLPPGPRLPASLQCLALQRDPVGVLDRAAARFGETFTLALRPPGRVVVTSAPAIVEEMLTGERELFRAGAATDRLLPFLGRRSLIVSDGDCHRRRRRLLLPGFGPKALEAWRPAVERMAAGQVARWPRRRAFAVLPRARGLAFDVIAAVLGVDDPGIRVALRRRLDRLAAAPVLQAVLVPALRRRLGGLGPWAVLERRLAVIDALLGQALRKPGHSGVDPPTVADHLAAEAARGGAVSEAEAIEELRTLLLVGHETAAAAIAWTVLLAAHHPEILTGVASERAARAVVDEALRVHPPVLDVVRELAVELPVDGYRLPAGTIMMAAPTLVHRRPDLHRAPDEFRPDRFLAQRPHPPAWIPFGGGPRRCLGAALARIELEGVLRAVAGEGRLLPRRRTMETARLHGTTLVPAAGGGVALEAGAHARSATSST